MKANFFEPIDCYSCGNNNFSILKQGSDLSQVSFEKIKSIYHSSSDKVLLERLVRCNNCNLVYINPRVSQSVIISSYQEAVDPKFKEQNKERIATFKNSISKISKFLGLTPSKNIKVLDIGCAGGAFPKAASDFGFSVTGIEPSQWLAQQAALEYKLDIRPGILDQQNFLPESFDIITLWDVIEHLTDPSDQLIKIHSLLKKDGVLVINYPDYSSLPAKLLGWKWPFYLSVHLIYFDPKTIDSFLRKCGFAPMKLSLHWQSLKLGYILERAADYFKVFNLVRKLVVTLKLDSIPVMYYLGQKMVIAKKI